MDSVTDAAYGDKTQADEYYVCYGPSTADALPDHIKCDDGSYHYKKQYKICCQKPRLHDEKTTGSEFDPLPI